MIDNGFQEPTIERLTIPPSALAGWKAFAELTESVNVQQQFRHLAVLDNGFVIATDTYRLVWMPWRAGATLTDDGLLPEATTARVIPSRPMARVMRAVVTKNSTVEVSTYRVQPAHLAPDHVRTQWRVSNPRALADFMDAPMEFETMVRHDSMLAHDPKPDGAASAGMVNGLVNDALGGSPGAHDTLLNPAKVRDTLAILEAAAPGARHRSFTFHPGTGPLTPTVWHAEKGTGVGALLMPLRSEGA